MRNLFSPLIALVLALVILAFLAGGCTTVVVSKTSPDGTVTKVEYYSWGKDQAVEELTIPTEKGPATVKGGKSGINPAVNDIAATMKNLSERVP